MIEAKDRGDVNPVPLRRHLLVLAECFLPGFLGSPPMIALADVPRVDLDSERERPGGRSVGMGGQPLDPVPGVQLGHLRIADGDGFESLAMSFAMDETAGQIQAEAAGHLDGLFGGHLGVEQGGDLLQVRRGRGVLVESEHQVRRKVPGLALIAPAVASIELEVAKARNDRTSQIVHAFKGDLVFPALQGRGVGLGLGGSLGQQPQQLPAAASHRFLHETEVLLRMFVDLLQALLHVPMPILEFVFRQEGTLGGQGRGQFGRGLGCLGRALLGHRLDLDLEFTALAFLDLAQGSRGGGLRRHVGIRPVRSRWVEL